MSNKSDRHIFMTIKRRKIYVELTQQLIYTYIINSSYTEPFGIVCNNCHIIV
jgi:hypothetical protein